MAKTVIGELELRRAALAAIDTEADGPIGLFKLSKLRAEKAKILEEIEALEVALRGAVTSKLCNSRA